MVEICKKLLVLFEARLHIWCHEKHVGRMCYCFWPICYCFRFQDGLVETLRRTRLKFVHCLLPQHAAGLNTIPTSLLHSGSTDDELLNIPLLRSQVNKHHFQFVKEFKFTTCKTLSNCLPVGIAFTRTEDAGTIQNITLQNKGASFTRNTHLFPRK